MNTPEASIPAKGQSTVAEEPLLPPGEKFELTEDVKPKSNIMVGAIAGGVIIVVIIVVAIYLFTASTRDLTPASQSLVPTGPTPQQEFATQLKAISSRLSACEAHEKSDDQKIDQLTEICQNYAGRVEQVETKNNGLIQQVGVQAAQIKELQQELDSYGGGFRQLPKPAPAPVVIPQPQ